MEIKKFCANFEEVNGLRLKSVIATTRKGQKIIFCAVLKKRNKHALQKVDFTKSK